MKKLEMAQQMQKQVTIVTLTTELLIISCFILSQHSIADEQNITCREISPTSANWTEPKHAGCIGNGTILFSLQPSFPTMH